MIKVFISGGLGYVGGRIARYLASQEGYYIKLGTRKDVDLPDWLSGKGEILKHDIMSNEDCERVCQGVDYVIHMAALNEIDSGLYPQEAFLVNTLGTLKLLEAAQKNNVKKFIYFSTAHVYGSPLAGEIDETKLCKPTHPYSITHKAAEDFVLASNNKANTFGIVLRLSNSFGAPINKDVNRWTLLVNDLCKQAIKNGEMVLKTTGIQKRDFITLSDVERAVKHFIELEQDKCGDGLFNLGGEFSSSIIEMTNRIKERCKVILNMEPKILKPENNNEQSMELKFSIEKLKMTDFEIIGEIDKEIDDTILFCKALGDKGEL